MDSFEILGIEDVDYTNKAGNRVKGCRLHLGCKTDKCHGVHTEVVFLTQKLIDAYEDKTDECIHVGDTIQIYYNRYGSVSNFAILDK